MVEEAVKIFFNLISMHLQAHQRIELRGFGSFSVRKRNQRTARNPQTGKLLLVKEKHVPFFRAGTALRGELKKNVQAKRKNDLSVIYSDSKPL